MKSETSEASLDNLLTILNDAQVDNAKLENQITSTIQNMGESSKVKEIPIEKIRKIFESAAVWILKNFSNPLLTCVINFISFVLTKLDFRLEINKEGKIMSNYRNYFDFRA